MWNTIKSNIRFNNYIWVQRVRSVDGGMMTYTEVEYPQIPITIMGVGSPFSRDESGSFNRAVYDGMVSVYDLTANNIKPTITNSYLRKGEDMFRLLDIEVFDRLPNTGVVYFTAERIEDLEEDE